MCAAPREASRRWTRSSTTPASTPSLHRRNVARRVHAAAAHQAGQQADRHHAGAALRRRVPGRGAQALRHAADPRRRRRRPQQGPRRRPRLPVGHPGAARRPRGGHDGGRAGRAGAQGGPRHRHGGQAIGTRDPSRSHRHATIPRAQHLEPDEDQPAALEPGLRRGAPRARAARGDAGGARGVPAGGRGQPEPGHPAGLRPRRRRFEPRRSGRRGRQEHQARTVAQDLSRSRPATRARSRRCCWACASGAARRSRRGATSVWASRASSARRAGSRGFMPPAWARPTPSCQSWRRWRKSARRCRSCSPPARSRRRSSPPSGLARVPCISSRRWMRRSTCRAFSTIGIPTWRCSPNWRSGPT